MNSESDEFTKDEFGMPMVQGGSQDLSHQTENKEPSEGVSTGRIEAFSDGVLAIAITLLVLEIHVPDFGQLRAADPPESLWNALAKQWPVYVAYLTSFLIIGIIWVNHHIVFKYIKRTDRWLLNLNLLLLLTVSFIPYPTDMLGEALKAQLDDNLTNTLARASWIHPVSGLVLALGWVKPPTARSGQYGQARCRIHQSDSI